MKVVCTKRNLTQGLAVSSRVISVGNTLPVLNNILLKTEGGRLKLSSTNLEVAINTWVGGKIEEEGELTIPARLINDYVSNLIAEKVTLSTQNQTLFIETERVKTHIKGLSSEEFPLIPQLEQKIYTKISGEALKQAINQVAFTSSFSETQPEISGVLFQFNDKTLTIAATDRYRLAEAKTPLSIGATPPRTIIIPTRAVNELGRVLGEGEMEVYLAEGQVLFRSPDLELISRLIEGQYPDYKQIIPQHFITEAMVERGTLIQSLKAASLFASDNNNVEIEIIPSGKTLVIRSQSAQTGDSEIRLDAAITGQKNTVIFNHHYILECLNNLDDDQVMIKVIDGSSPAVIVPMGRENYLYIVMPIKI